MNLAVAGGAAAGGALLATLLGWLQPRAALAAGLVAFGILAGSGWAGGLLLGMFVGSGSLLTRYLDPDGSTTASRTAGQVMANGGPAMLAALSIPVWPEAGWPLLIGALATAQADTWATEIGRTSRRPPRDLLSGVVVAPGTSGGVTWRGSAAGLAGTALMSLMAWPTVGLAPALAGGSGGAVGFLLDSALGGRAQARYLCTVCGTLAETHRHCDTAAPHARGLRGFGNSGVNAASTALGGMTAWVLWRVLGA